MSKLMTDSKHLMDLLFLGADYKDTPIYCTISDLKQCAFECMEMRITGYELSDEERDKLDRFNTVFVETWRLLSDIQNDFNDLMEEHFKQIDKQIKKGGGE